MALRHAFNPGVRVLLCVALVASQLATGTCRAGESSAQRNEPRPLVIDVALDANGVLCGQIVTREGQPAKGMPVAVFDARRDGPAVAQGKADDAGWFAIDHFPRGGVFLLATPSGGQLCRVWTQHAAPPSATSQVLVAVDATLVRGQVFCPTSLYEWFETHPVLGYGLATAVIAVPIILLTMDDDDDAAGSL